MTFLKTLENHDQIEEYKQFLSLFGALSRLYSDSDIPYLYYRIQEKLFCKVFNAKDLSRSDIAIDCTKENWGIGLKTFSSQTPQKIAEFNKARTTFKELSGLPLALKIAELRNKRINLVKDIHGDLNLIYHNVYREKDKMLIFEEPLLPISNEISVLSCTDQSLRFIDNSNALEYFFNFSKSTLFQRFNFSTPPLSEIPITIVSDPFALLQNLSLKTISHTKILSFPEVILPLYSTKYKEKFVPLRSGLNQWNARGRQRDPEEVYIPIPSEVHKRCPSFFPSRETPFKLILPNEEHLEAKICQDNGKALMSNPNKALGKWLLQKILHIRESDNEEEIVTYSHLLQIGFDSISVQKIDHLIYKIEFCPLDSYEHFIDARDENGAPFNTRQTTIITQSASIN